MSIQKTINHGEVKELNGIVQRVARQHKNMRKNLAKIRASIKELARLNIKISKL